MGSHTSVRAAAEGGGKLLPPPRGVVGRDCEGGLQLMTLQLTQHS